MLGTALDNIPKALLLAITLRVSGPDVPLMAVALALSNTLESVSATNGMRLASRSSAYVVSLWIGIAVGAAATTAVFLYLRRDSGPDLRATLKASGAGALVAVAAETIIPEDVPNAPRFYGVLAASGFAVLILLTEVLNP